MLKNDSFMSQVKTFTTHLKTLASIFKLIIIFLLVHVTLIGPCILIAICLLVNRKLAQWQQNVTKVKYYKYFPIFFYYDDKPKYYRNKDTKSLEEKLQPGDILLRRYDNYLDGVILSQTSYYTHAAIYYGEYEGENKVIHAVGDGVGFESIEQFAKCDSVAALRFDFDRIQFPDKVPPFILSDSSKRRNLINVVKDTVLDSSNEPIYNIRSFIEFELNSSNLEKQKIAREELDIYDSLMTYRTTAVQKEDILKLICRVAKVCQKKKYDYSFNFKDPEKFSCVEFVWHCYKSLYPLHQVSRQKFRYFSWIEALVLVPDIFLESEHLKLIYVDGREVNDYENEKQELIKFTKKQHLNFLHFIIELFLIQFILSLILMFIF